ncbi:MAG TPA: adenylate kinase [Longimicrobiales bacterium]|nr:adenylate kinase [Longimicrobiales bacterium]
MTRDVILFGPPGAGKGTQGALLADRLQLLRLSTGDVLRDAVRRGTAMGREAQRYMDAGDLVPDEVIIGIVRDYLAGEAASTGVIFDGFPRTLPQAERLDALLAELERPLRAVLVLDVDSDTLVKRLSGRRSCSSCDATYNVYFEPPREEGRCDRCGSALTQRADDEPDTVQRRLDVYREQTEPLIAYYAKSDTPVHHVDGDRPIEDVQRDLVELLAS